MHVVFQDVNSRLSDVLEEGRVSPLDFTELLYADDTLLLTKDARTASRLLAEIQKESAYYNMNLNQAKCNYIVMNKASNRKVRFEDGTPMESVDDAVYLGGTINKYMNVRQEIQ